MIFSKLAQQMTSFITRYGLLFIVAGIATHFVFDVAAMTTFATAFEAGIVMIVLAEISAYVYTRINFKEQDYSEPMATLGRYIVLGAIIIACAILVGAVFFGKYFTQIVPGAQ